MTVTTSHTNMDELGLAIFPQKLQNLIRRYPYISDIYLPIGDFASVVIGGAQDIIPISEYPVTQDDITHVINQIKLVNDVTDINWRKKSHRTGVRGTFNRVSTMNDEDWNITGLSVRFGRVTIGIADIISDLLNSGKNILIAAPPGFGKTTLLRDSIRHLKKRTLFIIDKSGGEFTSYGNTLHPSIKGAFVMRCTPNNQGNVMMQVLENNSPRVIMVDEIISDKEAENACEITSRGIQVVGTIHAQKLSDLINSDKFSRLIGGIKEITLGSDEARQLGVSKAAKRRAGDPAFDYLIQMVSQDIFMIYKIAEAVDDYLLGYEQQVEIRSSLGTIKTTTNKAPQIIAQVQQSINKGGNQSTKRVFAPGLSTAHRKLISVKYQGITLVDELIMAQAAIYPCGMYMGMIAKGQTHSEIPTYVNVGKIEAILDKLAA